MDARTFIDTQVVAHELTRKREQAAEAQRAAQARRNAGGASQARTRSTWRADGARRIGSSALATWIVVLVIAALLAATLMAPAFVRQRSDTVRGDGVQKQLVMRGWSPYKHQLIHGRGASSPQRILRGRAASTTHHLIASRSVGPKRMAV